MKTNVRETSLAAYDTLNLNRGQRKVIDFFAARPFGNYTRGEIAKMSGIPVNAVCGRVYELVDKGVLEELPRRACSTTFKQAHPLRLKDRQASLIGVAA